MIIGLPKGIIHNKSIELAKKFGVDVQNKKILFYSQDYLKFIFFKHRDIPRLINSGVIDIGITSTEWIEEQKLAPFLEILMSLDWCDTRISLITRDEFESKKEITCVTEFPNIARQYFSNIDKKVELINISGSTEGFVGNIFDCSVDCVETGSTLKLHNLIEKDVIFKSKIVLICKKDKQLDNEIIKLIKNYLNEMEFSK